METLQPYLIAIIVIFFFSAFVKCVTTFSILRYGLGFYGSGVGLVLVIISFALSMMILAPQLEGVGGLEKLFTTPLKSISEMDQKYSPILTKYTEPKTLERFTELAKKLKGVKGSEVTDQSGGTAEVTLTSDTTFAVLVTSYLFTEVKEAFKIGFLLLIPFFVLDLIVANVLLLLGATNIQHNFVALPLKVLLFFAIDGWQLLSEKLISGYL
ncbi:MAG: hypothetical protein ACOX2O_03305 [Bdellovibrionota bacterium]|jgi:flagellar biosynthesis protein FliP